MKLLDPTSPHVPAPAYALLEAPEAHWYVCHCYPLKIDSEPHCIGWNNLLLVLRLVEDIKTPDNQSIVDAARQ